MATTGKRASISGIKKEEILKLEPLKIDEDEIRMAFDFFDKSGKGKLTPADLKAQLSVFYKNLSLREYKFLISEPDFTVKTLIKLLADNELGMFDPVKEAFKLYDPQDTGYIDTEVLKQIFGNLGYGELSSDDLHVLVECADVDGDGKISLEDFRGMLQFNRQKLAVVQSQEAAKRGITIPPLA